MTFPRRDFLIPLACTGISPRIGAMAPTPETLGQQTARRPLKADVRLKKCRAGLEIVVPLGLALLAIHSSAAFAVSTMRH